MQRLDGVAGLRASLCLHHAAGCVCVCESPPGRCHCRAAAPASETGTADKAAQELAQLRSQVRCELLHSGDTNMLHQAPQVSVSPLQVAHQKTELGRLQRQQRSAGRAQEHSEEVRHPERQLDRFVMIGAI